MFRIWITSVLNSILTRSFCTTNRKKNQHFEIFINCPIVLKYNHSIRKLQSRSGIHLYPICSKYPDQEDPNHCCSQAYNFRYIMLYADQHLARPAGQTARSSRLRTWLAANKLALVLGGYGVLLLLVGLSTSSWFKRAIRKLGQLL